MLAELKIEHQYEVVPEIDHNGAAYYRKLSNAGFAVHGKAVAALSP
jgi:hypothetical protein